MALNPKHYRIILERELKKLYDEVAAYPSEEALWQMPKGISNSGGNLALHLIGNLKGYFGAALGGTDYLRDKSTEFSQKNVPQASILAEIEALFAPLKEIIEGLETKTLEGDFPQEIEGKTFPTELMLHHLLAHFTYHLGQINYHRRLLTVVK